MLLAEKSDAILTLTLNRPTARNALSPKLIVDLQAQIAAADTDPDVAVVILTGADPAFCAGVDLRVIGSDGGWDNMDDAEQRSQLPAGHPWAPISKPIIGAINGAAVTGGLELVLACDIVIASEKARFADTHARVGVMPLWGLTVRLPAAVGFGFAKRMSLTGNFVDAQTALAHGLVTEVVAHDELLSTARHLAADIATSNQPGVRTMLNTYRRIESHVAGPQSAIEADAGESWLAGDERRNVAKDAGAVIARGRSQLR